MQNYWENSQINFAKFYDLRLNSPVEAYQNTFNSLKLQMEQIEERLPVQTDIGMLRI